ncbi:MAG: hypothetical protein IT507_15605, partial [Burkholderiaceae bacterium]|nr:hypothetical protein [Burkholderiaceae bacterium]
MKRRLLALLTALPMTVLADSAGRHTQPIAVDHIVFATPDIQRSVKELEQRLGVRASPG